MVDDLREELDIVVVVEMVEVLLRLLLNGKEFVIFLDYDVVGLLYLEDEGDWKYMYFLIDFYFDNDIKDGSEFF